jgi:hypothetical protein
MKASRLHITRLVLATVLISAAVVLAETSSAARVKTVPIINVYSHHPVDIMPGGNNGSTQPYANAFLWKNAYCNTDLPCQEYDLIYSVGGNTNAFKIRVRRSGLCLMLDFRAPYRNGTRVIQYDCNATKRSKWWYTVRVEAPAPPGEPQSDYPYMLLVKNNYTRKCLDADNGAGGAPPRGAVLQQWDCISYLDDWNAGNQLWRDYK